MRIERLRLVVEEAEAAAWAVRLLQEQPDIAVTRVGFEPEAVVVEGRIRIPLAGEAPFRTVWTVAPVPGGRVEIRLAQASVFGWKIGSGFLTGLIMTRIEARLAGRAGFEVTGDSLLLDPAVLLAGLPVDLRLRITAVSLEPGRLILEAG